MKTARLTAALLLCAVMLLTLTSCLNAESKKFIGTWESEFDIAEYINAAISETMGEYAEYYHTDSLVMVLRISYYDDGMYIMTVDSELFAKECAKLVPAFTEGVRKTYEDIAGDRATTAEALLAEVGKTYDEIARDTVSALNAEGMADVMKRAGKFKADGERLYMSGNINEAIGSSYETYRFTDDGGLILTGYVGDNTDGNPFTYPMEFTKVK